MFSDHANHTTHKTTTKLILFYSPPDCAAQFLLLFDRENYILVRMQYSVEFIRSETFGVLWNGRNFFSLFDCLVRPSNLVMLKAFEAYFNLTK